MMLKVKAAQSERNRLSMLLAEYTDDVVASQNARAIKSRKDSLWSLVTKLLSAFDHPNPATHYLFENAPEINEKGIKNILSFYESGKSRFQQILLQDVYKTEPRVTAGHRARDISHYTYTQLESIKKQKSRQVDDPTHLSIVQQSTSSASQQVSLPSEINHPRKIRRTTTNAEKGILAQLFEFEERIPDIATSKVLSELQTVSSDWTAERVKQYWRNNCYKVQK